MKKVILLIMVLIIGISTSQAQEKKVKTFEGYTLFEVPQYDHSKSIKFIKKGSKVVILDNTLSSFYKIEYTHRRKTYVGYINKDAFRKPNLKSTGKYYPNNNTYTNSHYYGRTNYYRYRSSRYSGYRTKVYSRYKF